MTQFSKFVIVQPKTKIFPQNPCFINFPCKNPSKIMIITSHMQKIIQIYPCLLKLLRKQDVILKKSVIFQPKTKIFPKTLASNISMLEPIQDNDNYKPHAKNYSNLSMFTQVIA